jgi:hypothetical protein
MAPPLGVPPLRAVLVEHSATFASVPDMDIVPVASGVGSAHTCVPAIVVPSACLTRKYRPGWMVPLIVVTVHVVPADDAYCTDQFVIVTGAAVGLYNST